MIRRTLIALFVVLATAHAGAEAQVLTFEHDGLQRRYRVHVPSDLEAGAPLVLVLHGYGGSGAGMQNNFGWPQLADERGFAVAFPDGTRDQWNSRFWNVGYEFHASETVDDDGFLVALSGHLQALHDLDPERTFVTGFSNGGDMSFQLACRRTDAFQGFAPVCGTMMDLLYVDCEPANPRPILAISGTADGITLFGGDMDNSDGWGAYRPMPEVIDLWKTLLDVPILETTTLPDIDPNDGSVIEHDCHRSKLHPRELRFYRVVGGDHDWPGRSGNMDIDATREIWDFFESILPEPPANPADLDGDGRVNASDLGILLGAWGPGSPGGDVNGDGSTDSTDIGLLLGAWTG